MTTKKRKPLDLDALTIERGAHDSLSKGACIMEAVSYVAGEKWSDSPACASPILAAYLRNLNDAMDDTARQALKPLVPMCVGTNTGPADEQTRGLMAVDWLVREYTPTWLELAKLDAEAKALRSLPPIDSWDRLAESTSTLIAGQKIAAAARAAARAAALAAARAAAWNAARAAALAAAWDAARAAARDAALAAAGAAARKALDPTVSHLQASAVELAKRMAQVGK